MEVLVITSTLLLFFSLLAPLSLSTSRFSLSSSSSLSSSLPSPGDIASLENAVAGVWADFRTLLGSAEGDSRPALKALKSYLAQFGYLPLSPPGANVTEDFDDLLDSAVRLYQKSFRLPDTGVLDVNTLLHLMRPRCGREDVVDGVSQMLSPNPAPAPGVTIHLDSTTVSRYSFFPGTPKWSSFPGSLTYAFSPSNETDRVALDDRRQVFSDAFAAWAVVATLNFTEIDDFSTADIKIEFATFDHGDGEAFDGVLGVLAHAFSPGDGRFHLDNSEAWTTSLPAEMSLNAIDLRSVVTHEIGHLIGLGHSSVEDAIMYPSISPREVKFQLHNDDIAGAQALYGANPSYNPSTPLDGSQGLSDSSILSAPLVSILLISALLVLHLSTD